MDRRGAQAAAVALAVLGEEPGIASFRSRVPTMRANWCGGQPRRCARPAEAEHAVYRTIRTIRTEVSRVASFVYIVLARRTTTPTALQPNRRRGPEEGTGGRGKQKRLRTRLEGVLRTGGSEVARRQCAAGADADMWAGDGDAASDRATAQPDRRKRTADRRAPAAEPERTPTDAERPEPGLDRAPAAADQRAADRDQAAVGTTSSRSAGSPPTRSAKTSSCACVCTAATTTSRPANGCCSSPTWCAGRRCPPGCATSAASATAGTAASSTPSGATAT